MISEAAAYFSDALQNETEINDSSSTALPVRSNNEPFPHIAEIDRLPKGQSDEHLLLQVGNGGREALSILFHRHARSVFNVAKRILKDNSEAEDLLQELFLFVFQKARLFDPRKGAAASWIIQTVAS